MDARQQIHFATGEGSQATHAKKLSLVTTGVLVQAWWDLLGDVSVLIFDEIHIRSTAYSNLFHMVLPLMRRGTLKLTVMSATMHLDPALQFFSGVDISLVEIAGRRYPLYVFEPEDIFEFPGTSDTI